MISKFTVFGSCACRDIFYSQINPIYKNFFSIGEDGIRISLISLMQESFTYDEESINIYPINDKNIHISNWIKKDLEKSFLNVLKKNNFEYLLMDTYYDVNYGILEIIDSSGEKQYITNNIGLSDTSFYKNLNNYRILSINKNTNEYLNLWCKSCDLFFKFLDEYCHNTQVILNPVRDVYKVLTKDNLIVINEDFKKNYVNNKFRAMLDSYICENFDVDVLDFDENTLAFEDYKWGLYSFHYEPSYFLKTTYQLKNIIDRDNLLKSNNLLNFNKQFRLLKCKKALFKFKGENYE